MRLERLSCVSQVIEDVDFNSIKVRLEHSIARSSLPSSSDFNSIKVRLELSVQIISLRITYLFQFHKGAIRTDMTAAPAEGLEHFNSIKVRLERPCQDAC